MHQITLIPQVLARPRHVSIDNLTAAAAIYNSLYAVPEEEGGGVCATFQIVSLSGWVSICCHDVICSMPDADAANNAAVCGADSMLRFLMPVSRKRKPEEAQV